MRTSWDVLHEYPEDTLFCSGAMVLDNVLVLQVMMQLDLLLQGLVLSGEENTSGEEKEEDVCFAINVALSNLITPQGANERLHIIVGPDKPTDIQSEHICHGNLPQE